MKLFASIAVALALSSVSLTSVATAQTSTSGTASGSTAPNQLGTPLNGQTNQNSMATTAPGGGTSFGTLRSTERTATGTPTYSDSSLSATTNFGDPNYLTPYGSFPYGTQGTVRGNALPIPMQQGYGNANTGTTSATTLGPNDVPMNASPTPSPTP